MRNGEKAVGQWIRENNELTNKTSKRMGMKGSGLDSKMSLV